MKIFRDISLREYNTFGLDYRANCLISIKTEVEAISLLRNHKSLYNPILILGGGSNLLFTGDFNGTIIHPVIQGITIENKNNRHVLVSAGAGVIWDELVEWSVENGYGGLENLSLIPGFVGASPIQNIGAYGAEVKDTIDRVRTVKIDDGSVAEFTNNECHFAYRDSIFKKEYKGMYIVTRVYFRLNTRPLLNTGYGSLKDQVMNLGDCTLKNVRKAVIIIRQNKLPDTAVIGNAGSFFKNPVVDISFASELKRKYPDLHDYYDPSGGRKLAAGWLIDQCGWKGKRTGDAGVHDKQSLVLVNHGKATGEELYNLSEAIKESVFKKFGIALEREVEVI